MNVCETAREWRWFIPVLGLGMRTSVMAEMIVLFPLRLLTRPVILSVISLMGLWSRRWSSVDCKVPRRRRRRRRGCD